VDLESSAPKDRRRGRRGPGGTLILEIDGASRGNPGEAAAGVVISSPGAGVVREISKRLGVATNNEAEYRALLLGLEEASRLGAARVEVFSDSELLVRQMNGVYRVREPRLKPLHAKARALLSCFGGYEIRHVRREMNERADALCNLAFESTPD